MPNLAVFQLYCEKKRANFGLIWSVVSKNKIFKLFVVKINLILLNLISTFYCIASAKFTTV
jgi:hypothetical protein